MIKPVGQRLKAPEIGKLNVCAVQCENCLFGNKPLIPWKGKGGGEEKTRKALQAKTHFSCHEWDNAMCRGFYNKHGAHLWYVKLCFKNIHWVKK